MPSSMHYNLRFMIDHIISAKPSSILDVGVGYGKWGFLAREFLEAHGDRVFPEQWKVKIDGVEIFEDYIRKLPWIPHIYGVPNKKGDLQGRIYNNDISKIVEKLPSYEMIICGDIIEHMPKKVGAFVLKQLLARASKVLLLSIPLGRGWLDNKIVAGNKHEKHQSTWTAPEVRRFAGKDTRIRSQIDTMLTRGDIGAFAFIKPNGVRETTLFDPKEMMTLPGAMGEITLVADANNVRFGIGGQEVVMNGPGACAALKRAITYIEART